MSLIQKYFVTNFDVFVTFVKDEPAIALI